MEEVYTDWVNLSTLCARLENMAEDMDKIWDVVVIGGGPSGMMAAGRAAELGMSVLLVEKNDALGKKLLITGGGRCNVTNGETDTRKLLEKYKENGKFLFSAFSQWSVQNTLDFFHSRNMPTKEENEKRIFPLSNTAQSVWDVLVDYIHQNNVTVLSNSPVIDILKEDGLVTEILLKNKNVVKAKNMVMATGGTSRPETGSTGDAYAWLRRLGHTVIDPEPSLVPVAVKDAWVKRLSGVSLTDIKITTFQNGAKQESKKGKILFTHVGVSGPTVLNMSKDIGELLKYGEVVMPLDLMPHLGYDQLNLKLQELLKDNPKKLFRKILPEIIPSSMASIVSELSGIDPESTGNEISREERLKLVKFLKAVPMEVDHLLGTDKAIITSGGVSLEEVDWKSMRSRLIPNLYLIGDVLNVDRPSGGYSLQLCWTTGYVAGTAAAEKL
ncbi:MAG: flavoprotein [Parcubacteria group bacterium]|nr:flavoprotein [Parcubacteria group bacterium]